MKAEEKQLVYSLKSPAEKRAAFKLLMDQYQERLYFAIRKILIDHDDTNDALQECFIKIWNKIDTFNEEASLYTWMYKIAVNQALQQLRKRKNSFKNEQQYTEFLETKISNSTLMDGDEIQKLLQQAILKLPEKQRLVFNMKYYDDLKYEEIAEITDGSVGSLKASYHHAVKKIEEFLKSH
ncbi:RNA polymerase sigma factor [Marivirga harenae]|uniref:RNA polymerase sigma factor n=1 Tax=Marivirga harenae TaxID=2010992 RepID=UPI0026DFD5AF|nr:sigma-70 family RNA polymerase sigma factor [Marivirga harenae]WKV10549.1 sigma-70 family RNA polymerase sigma factor [Marivirga harenae]